MWSVRISLLPASSVPEGNHIHAVHGFVEELVVIDDPEYQWIDKIRSMRASNEARQVQFSKLSGNISLIKSLDLTKPCCVLCIITSFRGTPAENWPQGS